MCRTRFTVATKCCECSGRLRTSKGFCGHTPLVCQGAPLDRLVTLHVDTETIVIMGLSTRMTWHRYILGTISALTCQQIITSSHTPVWRWHCGIHCCRSRLCHPVTGLHTPQLKVQETSTCTCGTCCCCSNRRVHATWPWDGPRLSWTHVLVMLGLMSLDVSRGPRIHYRTHMTQRESTLHHAALLRQHHIHMYSDDTSLTRFLT